MSDTIRVVCEASVIIRRGVLGRLHKLIFSYVRGLCSVYCGYTYSPLMFIKYVAEAIHLCDAV